MCASMTFALHGHRGARGLRPENTLPAFAAALSIGVDALELDVAVTRDGAVVVIHDRALNPAIVRAPDGAWLRGPMPFVHSLTFDEVTRYDVGRIDPASAYAREFPDQQAIDGLRIPTLDDVVGVVRASGNERVRLNVEIKSSPLAPEETLPPDRFAGAVIGTLRSLGFERRAIVQSFDWRVLQQVREIAPEVEVAHLTVQRPWMDTLCSDGTPSLWTAGFDLRSAGSVPLLVTEAGGARWAPYHEDLTPDDLDEAHALGLEVLVWTVNDPERMRELIDLGIDAIITDYPDRLRKVMLAMGLPVPAATPVEAPTLIVPGGEDPPIKAA
jgi:glycerophosphoryl diester phosphodiesterase